tara:strand:- start:6388 stop:9096 length:2709 start_codon:yes stop_codon:yes gene_type:complete
MLDKITKRIFGTANQRLLKGMERTLQTINNLEPDIERLTNDQIMARTDEFRDRLGNGESLDNILPEAFSCVREAGKRTLGQRHFNAQIVGGLVLHQGNIAEMKTGEGKTLAATLPVYLNALQGTGVHVVTVNDYLAQRDAKWMSAIYNFLGLEAACIVHGLSDDHRREAYSKDVTYGTNNELGFDYLRDNMKFRLDAMVQRPFNYAIVDEVDSILVDEARTPLIISGPTEDKSELYKSVNEFIPSLNENEYEKDEKSRTVTLTDIGVERIEKRLREAQLMTSDSLYDVDNVSLVHHVNQALRAHLMFSSDVDYLVKNDKIIIIDEFTGRMMEGRRYSEGLHQALEAKENVTIQNENQTLASITFQNFFRLYPKLAGMTGTAATEASEFADIYGLAVAEIPTNLPMIRLDNDDQVYRTSGEKHKAILSEIRECRTRGQPVLVGTVSIEKSEELASLLKEEKIPHNVLNARYHEEEALIIAQAGRLGAVTIATNMAGRGTDIQLGGNAEMRSLDELNKITDPAILKDAQSKIEAEVKEEKKQVIEAGGLYIIGTERHESRRIDNQLRGRSGRQGDPGASKFFLSLEDDLMRIFGSKRMDTMLRKLGLQEGEAIIHTWINKAIEKAQSKVEARNFDVRKNLLKFDNVMNDQRKVIYSQRIELMSVEDVSETVADMRHEILDETVSRHMPEKAYPEQWDADGLRAEINRILGLELPISQWAKEEGIADEEVRQRVINASDRAIAEKVANYGPEVMRMVEKTLLLQLLDQHWKDHLLQLDHLRSGIGLRAYGQRDPLREYQGEAFSMFEAMLSSLREQVTTALCHVQLRLDEEPKIRQPTSGNIVESRVNPFDAKPEETQPKPHPPPRRTSQALDPGNPSTWGKVPRNAPCPCDSGKKYKQCHGKSG